MTSQECRNRIVRHLAGRGWVPIADLAVWLRDELGLTRTQGDADLRTLVLTGEIDRRATGDGWVRHYEYRVPIGQHSGRSRIQRRIEEGR